MTSIDGVQSVSDAKATLGNEYRAIRRPPKNEIGPDLLDAINPEAIEDVTIVLRNPTENPREDEEASFKGDDLPTEQWLASVEIIIRPSFTSTVGVEEYRTKRSFGFDPEAGVCR